MPIDMHIPSNPANTSIHTTLTGDREDRPDALQWNLNYLNEMRG